MIDAKLLSVNKKIKNLKQEKRQKQSSISRSKRANGLDIPYNETLRALWVYHSKHGDLVIPRRYIIPSSDTSAYPNVFQGVNLSSTVYNMKWWEKHIKLKADRVIQLTQLEFSSYIFIIFQIWYFLKQKIFARCSYLSW